MIKYLPTEPVLFSLAEKLVIVKLLDSVILADDYVDKRELSALQDLMGVIDFDSNFILQARNIADEHGLAELRKMPIVKKRALAELLENMANSDGFLHEKETTLILQIRTSIGLEDDFK